MGYSIEQFVEDCESLGWYDPEPDKSREILYYEEHVDAAPFRMDYRRMNDGVFFSTTHGAYAYGSEGKGFVNNKKDLLTYMKVVGRDKGFIPKDLSKKD